MIASFIIFVGDCMGMRIPPISGGGWIAVVCDESLVVGDGLVRFPNCRGWGP